MGGGGTEHPWFLAFLSVSIREYLPGGGGGEYGGRAKQTNAADIVLLGQFRMEET
jgi:hypothetical protein